MFCILKEKGDTKLLVPLLQSPLPVCELYRLVNKRPRFCYTNAAQGHVDSLSDLGIHVMILNANETQEPIILNFSLLQLATIQKGVLLTSRALNNFADEILRTKIEEATDSTQCKLILNGKHKK